MISHSVLSLVCSVQLYVVLLAINTPLSPSLLSLIISYWSVGNIEGFSKYFSTLVSITQTTSGLCVSTIAWNATLCFDEYRLVVLMPITVNVLFLLGGVAVIGNDSCVWSNSEFEVDSELKELLVLISKLKNYVLTLTNRQLWQLQLRYSCFWNIADSASVIWPSHLM